MSTERGQYIAKRVFDETNLTQNYESAKFLSNFSTNYRQTCIKRSKIFMQKVQIIQKKCIFADRKGTEEQYGNCKQ